MEEYFKEAQKWYYTRYVRSLRFLFVIGIITLLLIGFGIFAVQEVVQAKNSQKQVSKVIFTDHDVALFSVMEKIGKYYHSNDLNILFYTLTQYIENIESYPKNSNQYSAHIQKLHNLQKYSSQNVLQQIKSTFQTEYSQKLNSGGFVRAVIQNVDFGVEEKSFTQKFHNFLLPRKIPKKANVTVLLYIFDGKALAKQTKTVEINFTFDKIQKQKDGTFNKIKFFVDGYRTL